MRLAWYAGTSMVLAAAVVLSAFHQRANFYSAMVYLYQSKLCMMILVNLIALVYSSFVYSLQRVCFGRLRAIEVEQLYEKAWFAVTETCLAMTIFRDEIGAFFVVMFVALLTGKVWGWIGEGRIDALEQQPPTNPRLFHTRLIISLCLSLTYDVWLLYYAVSTVIDQARPDMMVLFLFEFAVLLITSVHTVLRYSITLLDSSIVKRQTRERLQDRRRIIREEREEILHRRQEAKATAEAAAAMGQEGGEEALKAAEQEESENLPDEDDVDEMDIEVAGWEAKGQYILGLDLWTDFTKLCIYAVFFFVLLRFYGLPLHIIRDLFMTARSFIKRLGAMIKYRQAIKDMNRYSDATEEDLARENTCIICREDMHVWAPNDRARIERTRPKKLPCGHILHLGCLRSWMERQQVCPTCRRSVVIDDAQNANRNHDAAVFRMGLNLGGQGAAAGANGGAVPAPGANGVHAPQQPHRTAPPHANGQQVPGPAAGAQAPGLAGGANFQPPPPRGNLPGLRMFNFGPIRLGFAQGGAQDIQEMAQRLGLPGPVPGANGAPNGVPNGEPQIAAPRAAHSGPSVSTAFGFQAPWPSFIGNTSTSTASLHSDLQAIERRIEQGILELQVVSAEAQTLRAMLVELQNIRMGENMANLGRATVPTPTPTQPPDGETPAASAGQNTAAVTTEQTATGPGEASTTRGSEAQPLQTTDSAAAPALATAPNSAQIPLQSSRPAHDARYRHLSGQFGASRPVIYPGGGQAQFDRTVTGAMPNVTVQMVPAVNARPIPANSAELPPGVQIPQGWSLIPLQPIGNAPANANAGSHVHVFDGARTWQIVLPGQARPSNGDNLNNAGNSASADANVQAESSQQSPPATAEDNPGTAPASSSSEHPVWGGSAQMFQDIGTPENATAVSSGEDAARGT
ncbi:E3 ubiquitin-protein ligase hrd1 [Sporothrix epigloea]|uniref:RING-type E3 ubiquitin transferase n=1 Tax=Sporothrix epigloea TaxID=1892477 RepID=A0ABP0DNU1_9PEZI